MSIYDVNFKDNVAPQLLPPDKRNKVMLSYLKALLTPVQWIHAIFMGSYRKGAEAQPWTPGTYKKYDQVIYKQKVYTSLKSGNTDSPIVNSSWAVVQDNFIGAFERSCYDGNKLNFEYGINKYFRTTFRQPPNRSDIYIAAQPKPKDAFVVGGSENNSSVVYAATSTGFVINDYNFGTYYNMIIYVPAALYNSLDTVPLNRERIIRNYADQYIIAGVLYQIIPY